MIDIQEYIKSGILDLYVLGLTSEEENREIENLSLVHVEIRNEIDDISESLSELNKRNADYSPKVSPNVKPFLLAIIDYTERLKNGEEPAFPPALSENTTKSDFSTWLDRPDMTFDPTSAEVYAKIIGYTPEVTTAIVWLKLGSPPEIHDNEIEKFFILEGSCDITIEDRVFSLAAGNYFEIPLHLSHWVKVTSEIPCKLILQRMAA